MVYVRIRTLYHLPVLQQYSLDDVSTSINPEQRCNSLDELFNSTIASLPLIQQVKFYPLLCENESKPVCFYDELYMCTCTNENYPNCFKFAHKSEFKCSDEKYCQNDAVCLQDDLRCLSDIICISSDCYFGTQCQFYAKGFGLILIDILRYEIDSKFNLSQQKFSIKLTREVPEVSHRFKAHTLPTSRPHWD